MSSNGASQPELSSLIFPDASTSISHFHRAAARSRLTISSRLHSIAHDARFVAAVAAHYDGLPLVANERCGSWYIPPGLKQGSVYFKSTDGHAGQWRCSTRRLNLHLLELIAQHGGCIIVDSTRRGKSMPDALSKTIPIWIATVNRLLHPSSDDDDEVHALHTPPAVVSASEHAQIASRLPSFAHDLRVLGLDLSALRAKLSMHDFKPLRPHWLTQQATSSHPFPSFTMQGARPSHHHPVILCTASGRDVQPDPGASGSYVQGAADDAEAWAAGLTPALFWAHREKLLACAEDELPTYIAELVAGERDGLSSTTAVTGLKARAPSLSSRSRLICPTDCVHVGALDAATKGFDCVVACCTAAEAERFKGDARVLHLACQPGKLGSRALRGLLDKAAVRVGKLVDARGVDGIKVLAVCTTGRDHSVGVALTLLCLFVDDEGRLGPRRTAEVFTKELIRRRLSWIAVEIPEANPSRATLQSVNAHLLGDRV